MGFRDCPQAGQIHAVDPEQTPQCTLAAVSVAFLAMPARPYPFRSYMRHPAIMSTVTPIVIFHKGRTWYLPYVLHQAQVACPSSEVMLASEIPVPGFPLLPLNNFENIKRAATFRRCYQHMSTNPQAYELFCYLRWFYLLEYMELRGLQRVLHLDSDFLLYCSMEELAFSHPVRSGEAGPSIPAQSHESLAWLRRGSLGLFTA